MGHVSAYEGTLLLLVIASNVVGSEEVLNFFAEHFLVEFDFLGSLLVDTCQLLNVFDYVAITLENSSLVVGHLLDDRVLDSLEIWTQPLPERVVAFRLSKRINNNLQVVNTLTVVVDASLTHQVRVQC